MGRTPSDGDHPGQPALLLSCGDSLGGSLARYRRIGRSLLVPTLLLAAAAAATSVDCRLSPWAISQRRGPDVLRDALRVAELFGHGLAALLIVMCVHQLDPVRRWAVPRVLAGAWLAGMAANVVKLMIVRTRPHHFHFEGDVWSTFGQWMPMISAGSRGQSFPSGHTATAFGLAIVLTWLYPRGRYAFMILASLVACQRIASGSHYLSDVLVAAALGLVVGRFCTLPCRPWTWTDRWERLWQRGATALRASIGLHRRDETHRP